MEFAETTYSLCCVRAARLNYIIGLAADRKVCAVRTTKERKKIQLTFRARSLILFRAKKMYFCELAAPEDINNNTAYKIVLKTATLDLLHNNSFGS